MNDDRKRALRARLTHTEIVELEQHAVQVLIDTFKERGYDLNPCYRARDKIDALYEVAKRKDLTKNRLMVELGLIRETMRSELGISDAGS